MLTKGINFLNFKKKKLNINIKKKLNIILKEDITKFKKNSNFRIIGIGGSSLGTKAIYDFLRHKIKKNFKFFDNLNSNSLNTKKKCTNLIISKSGDTLETIVNSNIFIKKNDKNIFITENKKNYLHLFAQKLKADIIHHNNFIGGRFSVLSEVGMLPAELMGLKSDNFKRFNYLVKNKNFMNSLISNVGSIIYFSKKKKI